ncbi:putative glutamate--cysteine ligase 2 [Virgisporangium aliadipatigenens]|uniref:Putative glutamate--cysteine ligase 2 n=1 Tax=Virgisporangium aliadipatigenens TaxID=741659 RepID=A0A8J3YSC4_9ACTN|nr:putative glutamate--cysteine ligase 2 [Virgisporangium aliadipatigenens]
MVGATIGVEEEFHLVDPETGELVAGARRLLAADTGRTGADAEAELRLSMIEIASGVCTSLDELRADLAQRRAALRTAAERVGLAVAGCATVPDSGTGRAAIYPNERYEWMADQYRQLVDEHQICATQVQVGVPDRDLAVRLTAHLRPWLPVLLAMSGSSPLFRRADTGYASYRSVALSRWPTSGPPPLVSSAAEYDAAVQELVDSGAICDAGMIYFDVRPSARYPTLEIRVSDACPLLDDVVLLAGLARALVVTAAQSVDEPGPAYPLLRAATWRAARSGLDAELVHPVTGRPVPAADAVRALLEHVRPGLESNGDLAIVRELTADLLARGTSARRQRAVLAGGGDLRDVVDSVVAECRRT